MDEVTIVRATTNDTATIEAILQNAVQWLAATGAMGAWRAESVTWQAMSGSYRAEDFYLAYLNGIAAGCMAVWDEDSFFWPEAAKGTSLYLHKLAVTQDARKTGVSQALMDHFKLLGRIAGVSAVQLETNARNPKQVEFYEKHGYVLQKLQPLLHPSGREVLHAYYAYTFAEEELQGERLYLREREFHDIQDWVRWNTTETEWHLWDAPWEKDPFDAGSYQQEAVKRLVLPKEKDALKRRFEICLRDAEHSHIGWVNSYYLEDDLYPECPSFQGTRRLAIGICIPPLWARRQGYAAEAWRLALAYYKSQGLGRLFSQTWSGNVPVLGLIAKLGFNECCRRVNLRVVRGSTYDALTFYVDLD